MSQLDICAQQKHLKCQIFHQLFLSMFENAFLRNKKKYDFNDKTSRGGKQNLLHLKTQRFKAC